MPETLTFTEAQRTAFRTAYAPTATDAQWSLFISECERRNLVPGIHVIFQIRNAMEYSPDLNRKVSVPKVTLITTINALRLIAERSGKYEGHRPFLYWYSDENETMKESKIPLGRIPHAVSVEGFRKDWREPLFSTARYEAYCQYKQDGAKEVPTKMWATRGEEQLAKCCEAGMLRAVAPEECAGLYLDLELGRDGVVDTEPENKPEPAVVPTATAAPAVNQASAVLPQTSMFKEYAEETVFQPLKPTPPASGGTDPQMTPVPVVVPAASSAPSPAPVAAPAAPAASKDPEPQPVNQAPQTAPAVQAAPPPKPSPAPTGDDVPATPLEYKDLINTRATKIIRDKLPKGGMKDSAAANGVRDFLLKQSGKATLNKISAAVLERLIKSLEDATPEQAVEIVKVGSK